MMSDVTIGFEGEQLANPWFPVAEGAPSVIIFPTVMGVSPNEEDYARRLNTLGYSAMIGDVFGTISRGASREEMMGHLQRLRGDRPALLRRLQALHEAMLGVAKVLSPRTAAIGFCFGGLCVLDLARSGIDMVAVGSFHGLFTPTGMAPQPIKARVGVYHGWDDPHATPDAVVALAKELTEAGASWQIDSYGNTGHGFTNPHAAGPGMGYDKTAATHSWASCTQMLGDVFG